jgi:hypothetical protein
LNSELTRHEEPGSGDPFDIISSETFISTVSFLIDFDDSVEFSNDKKLDADYVYYPVNQK